MQYANGVATNEAIFKSACALMYKYGYKKTTYQMIADSLQIPAGLVNYHYKKQELLTRIYRDYIQAVSVRIEETVIDRLDNELQFHMILSNVMMTQIFSDPNILRFHLEVNENNLIPQEIHDIIRSRQVKILDHFHIDITSEYYYWCATAEYGARRELLLLNRNLTRSDPDFPDFLNLLSSIAVRIAGVKQVIVQENLEHANEIFWEMDYSDIHMFPLD